VRKEAIKGRQIPWLTTHHHNQARLLLLPFCPGIAAAAAAAAPTPFFVRIRFVIFVCIASRALFCFWACSIDESHKLFLAMRRPATATPTIQSRNHHHVRRWSCWSHFAVFTVTVTMTIIITTTTMAICLKGKVQVVSRESLGEQRCQERG
jgi:hypothetical protein